MSNIGYSGLETPPQPVYVACPACGGRSAEQGDPECQDCGERLCCPECGEATGHAGACPEDDEDDEPAPMTEAERNCRAGGWCRGCRWCLPARE